MDKDLILEQTETTPYVEAWCDLQLICIGGTASAPDSLPVFNQVNAWLDENLGEFVGGVTFEFNFQYLSPSYSLSVLDLFRRMNDCGNDAVDISVRWYCLVESDIYYQGLDLKEMTKTKFELSPYYRRQDYKKKL